MNIRGQRIFELVLRFFLFDQEPQQYLQHLEN